LFSLEGRRAIVTGGAGLLGRVFAATLAELGAEVVMIDLDETRLAPVVDAIAATGGRATPLVGDLCDEAWVTRAIGELAGGGTIDVLVNSAAIDPMMANPQTTDQPAARFVDYPLDAFERSLHVNLAGAFLITREVCRVMETQGERGRGAIVNISSTYGLVGPDQRIYDLPGQPPGFKPVDYPTTKAGLLGFTRALAAYYRGTEIRVNALVPGGAFDDHDPAFATAYGERTILGRMAEPDEYRGALAFLSSDASSYMTGSVLVVDGGWTAW
jgi:2-deoxy-D-gluconate 3-dehydrogenase